MTAPDISTVMGVYNGAANLAASIQSVLDQSGVDLEFIIVDDGSTDATPAILDEYATRDRRIRVLRQAHQGLTRALIWGCAAVRGRYIARQDCGDLSLPGRFKTELDVLQSTASAALVSCATRFVGPGGELLYEVAIAAEDADRGLMTLDPCLLRGPAHHGSTMFRRDVYERVGCYREEFHFAQDLDLWTRLAEQGRHIAIADVLYQARFALGSISSLHRDRQIGCARVILECARLRRSGLSEAAALKEAAVIVPESRGIGSRDRAAASYFVGVCLRNRADPRARRYFRDALREYPLHLKSALRLLTG